MTDSDRSEMELDAEAAREVAEIQDLADKTNSDECLECNGTGFDGPVPMYDLDDGSKCLLCGGTGRVRTTILKAKSYSAPKPRLVFDIETAPLQDAEKYLDPVKVPSNYRDPVKIRQYQAQKREEQLDGAGLDLDLCRIVAIGWCVEGYETFRPLRLTVDFCSEEGMLVQFWNIVKGCHLVGFNCLEFDLPILLRRSLYLGVEAPKIALDRFKHPDITDLMQVLSFDRRDKWRGLDFYCRRFGIDVADDMRGDGIAAAVQEGRWDDIRKHVDADVRKTAALAQKLGMFSGVK